MEKENREYKDSVFVDLFYSDETAMQNLLSLYNALHDTDLKDESLIKKVKIDDILYKNFKNDISFEIDGRMLIFGEHQSTVNPNMPLRCLMYAGRAYEQLVSEDVKYKSALVKIATPEFYVFYNGVRNAPVEQELLLSNAFFASEGKERLELKVKVMNINSDKSHIILNKCKVLKEYSAFVDIIRKYKREGSENAIRDAINECINNGILAEYLKRKGKEVRNMLVAEYNYEKDIAVKQEEAREEGLKRGKINALKETAITLSEMGMAIEDIAKAVKTDENVVREWLVNNSPLRIE